MKFDVLTSQHGELCATCSCRLIPCVAVTVAVAVAVAAAVAVGVAVGVAVALVLFHLVVLITVNLSYDIYLFSIILSLSDYYYDISSSLRLIDTEAAAISSSTHLLWSMGGKEREALGSKCIAGLQVMSCARAQISNDVNSDRNSNSSSSGGRGGDRGGSSYDSNNSDSNRRKSDGSGGNKISVTVNSNSIREQHSSSSSSIGSKEEHILIFKRPLKKSVDDAGEKFITGDRVIISLEMDSRPFRACKNPPTGDKSVSTQSTHSVDIEDLGSTNKNSRICSSSGPSSSSSASMESDDLSAPYLVEPHIITGQIVKLSFTAIHISVKERPRRFLRYGYMGGAVLLRIITTVLMINMNMSMMFIIPHYCFISN